MERKYKYLGYFMMLCFPLVFVAFYTSYFKNFPSFSDRIIWFDHIHAMLATIWILMLVVQPILAANKKYDLHRKIGRMSYFIFPLLILSFIPREVRIIESENSKDIFFPVADTLVLISLYILAIYNKGNVTKHMRYMIASALVFLGPTVGRIGPNWFGWSAVTTQNVQYGIIFGVLIGLSLYDAKIKRSRPFLVAMGLFGLHALTFYYLYI